MKEPSLTEFIQKTIDEINNALPDGYAIDESIDFEISVITTRTKEGGLDVKVVSGKMTDDKEILQKINFSIVNSEEQEKSIKKTGDTIIKYFTKAITELTKIPNIQQEPKKLKKSNGNK